MEYEIRTNFKEIQYLKYFLGFLLFFKFMVLELESSIFVGVVKCFRSFNMTMICRECSNLTLINPKMFTIQDVFTSLV